MRAHSLFILLCWTVISCGPRAAARWVAPPSETAASVAQAPNPSKKDTSVAVPVATQLMRGLHAELVGDLPVAADALRLAVLFGGENADVLVHQARIFAALGHWEEARTLVRRALQLSPDHPRALELHGAVALDTGDFLAAQDAFAAAVAAGAGVHALEGWMRASAGVHDAQQTRAALSAWMARKNVGVSERLRRASALREHGQLKQAWDEYRGLLNDGYVSGVVLDGYLATSAALPKLRTAMLDLERWAAWPECGRMCWERLAMFAADHGDEWRALRAFSALDPVEDSSLLARRIEVQLSAGLATEAAAFLSQLPVDAYGTELSARVALAAGDPPGALDSLGRYSGRDTAEMCGLRAEAIGQIDGVEAGLTVLATCIERWGATAVTEERSISMLADAGRWSEMEIWASKWDARQIGRGTRLAIDRYERAGRVQDAVRLASLGVEKWPELGAGFARASVLVAMRTGDLESAWVRVESSLERWPEDAELWYLAGRINWRLQDLERASVSLEKALSLRPNDPETQNDYAYLLLENKGSAEQALELARDAAERRPDCVACLDTMGVAQMRTSRWSEALLSLQEANARAPGNAVIRSHLESLNLRLAKMIASRVESGPRLDPGDE